MATPAAFRGQRWREPAECSKIPSMPLVERGPLRGFYAPDYGGRSTVNLLSSVIEACGGTSPHGELDAPGVQTLQAARCILYLVVDGLGQAQLDRHLSRGQGGRFFARHRHTTISTVFPATTAAAVTTFDTGTTPTEHAILSWYLHLPDLGCVATVLRTTTRMGTPLFPPDFDLRGYYDVPSYVESVAVHRAVLSWKDIPHVPFAAVGTYWEDRRSYLDLEGLVETTATFAAEAGRRLAYVYWPRYDGLCHEVGCTDPQVDAHFEEIDAMLALLVERLAGTQTTLCVLADHGLIDVAAENCIDLAQVPGLMQCLATAPAGDQRQQSCFVRPDAVDDFLALVHRNLGHACHCIPGRLLLEAGVFGPGRPHPALRQRLGDYVLLCKDGFSLIHTPPGLSPVFMPGSHGGMSAPEIQVPLYMVECP